jgi:hypothetical protein
LQFLSSSEWPAVAVFALIALRRPLKQLIGTLRAVSYKDFKADFGEQLKKAQQDALQVSAQSSPLPPVDTIAEGRFRAVVDLSPNAAIFEAWLNVEFALRDLAISKGIPLERGFSSALYLTRVLQRTSAIDRRTVKLIDDMRALRNVAVHPEDEQAVTAEQAEAYKELADRVVAQLRAAR